MDLIANLALPLFLILAGLAMCGVVLPRWLTIIGGISGIIAGILLLVGMI